MAQKPPDTTPRGSCLATAEQWTKETNRHPHAAVAWATRPTRPPEAALAAATHIFSPCCWPGCRGSPWTVKRRPLGVTRRSGTHQNTRTGGSYVYCEPPSSHTHTEGAVADGAGRTPALLGNLGKRGGGQGRDDLTREPKRQEGISRPRPPGEMAQARSRPAGRPKAPAGTIGAQATALVRKTASCSRW